MNFFQKIAAFMAGRNGMDKLNLFLLAAELVIYTVNLFVWNRWARLVIFFLEAGLLALIIFRMLSRNITMRSKENRTFLKLFEPVKNWFTLQIRKFKERKDYKYLKCPYCKAQLRVKNQKGSHGVRCPKCGGNFSVKI